jgi:NADPH:quinone reductase-like Zn-dependent oxidoreductase
VKAIVQDVYGSADVLQLRDVEPPRIGAGEVLVQVNAAGVDPGVWHLMTGLPYLMRPVIGLRRPKVPGVGRAFAGVVTAVGGEVTAFRPGDEVYGTCESGAFAEYAVAKPGRLARKPKNLSFEAAAAVPISAPTALNALRKAGRVRPGQRVMVIGAAGGVGSYAVQVATALGARVTAVCGPAKAELVRSLGAADVIDYTREEIDRDGAVYDVVIDTAGNRSLSLLRRAVVRGGTLVLIGGEQRGSRLLSGMSRALLAPFAGLLARRRMRAFFNVERGADLEELTAQIEAGAVTPVIDRTYALTEAPDAIRYLRTGHPTGKVVVTATQP